MKKIVEDEVLNIDVLIEKAQKGRWRSLLMSVVGVVLSVVAMFCSVLTGDWIGAVWPRSDSTHEQSKQMTISILYDVCTSVIDYSSKAAHGRDGRKQADEWKGANDMIRIKLMTRPCVLI